VDKVLLMLPSKVEVTTLPLARVSTAAGEDYTKCLAALSSVPQQMRSGVGQPRSGIGLADGLAYEISANGFVAWCSDAHEDRTVGGSGALLLEVSRDGLPCGCWKR